MCGLFGFLWVFWCFGGGGGLLWFGFSKALIGYFAHKLCPQRRAKLLKSQVTIEPKSLDYDKRSDSISCQSWSYQHCSFLHTVRTPGKASNVCEGTQHLRITNTEPFIWTQLLFCWWRHQASANPPTSTVVFRVIPDAHGRIFGQLLQITRPRKGNRRNLARGNWIKHYFRQSPSWFCTVKQPRLQLVAAWGAQLR